MHPARFRVALVVILLTGCVDRDTPPDDLLDPSGAFPRGEHPYPRGDEWPTGLVGPFAVRDYEHLQIPTWDGVVLDGGVVRPDLPPGVAFPTVLLLTPYVGLQNEPGDSPAILDYTFDAPVRALVEAGFAFATVSIRGTSNSGGCFGFFSPEQIRDAPLVVDWIANQSWSNGRVGMMGVSYPATMALAAAIGHPEPLKALIVGGTHGDPYLRVATPQGALQTYLAAVDAGLEFVFSFAPPATSSDPQYATIEHAPKLRERLCPDGFEARAEVQGVLSDDRSPGYWDARRLSDHFADVTAATWYVQGYQDAVLHFTDDLAWTQLSRAPKRLLSGLWDHELPTTPDFTDQTIEWFDFWLKGIGDAPPGTSRADYQDGLGDWHLAHAWPPETARNETLYLDGETLSIGPGTSSQYFQSVPRPGPRGAPLPVPAQPYDPASVLCEESGAPGTSIVATTVPLAARALIAGNPYAFLHLTSDQPSGLVTMDVFDLGPGFACDGPTPQDARYIGFGAADLRFHAGTHTGTPFPTGTATWVRIDVHGIQEPLGAGHRLGLALSFGDPAARHTQPGFPTLEVSGESHLVLPVVDGTFGGTAPTIAAPPRPFQGP